MNDLKIKWRGDIDESERERASRRKISKKIKDFAENVNDAVASELRIFMIRRELTLDEVLSNLKYEEDLGERRIYYKDEQILHVELEAELGKLPEITMTCCYLREDLCNEH